MSRDTTLGLDFAAVNYYDGQGFIVRKSLNINSALQLNDAAVCVQQGTTTELNLADYFRSNNMSLKTVTFATSAEAVRAYDTGRCDAYTTDSSGLYAERLRLTDPNAHIVLPEIISKEPLAPAVRQGDDSWEDLVRWTHEAMVDADPMSAFGSKRTRAARGCCRATWAQNPISLAANPTDSALSKHQTEFGR
jgi:general L-amino acid transport system substrate-binding protein